MTDTILVITAHPDDAEFLFGATVAMLVHSGSPVSYVIVTDGERGLCDDPLSPPAAVSQVRRTEQTCAATLLGVRDVTFLGRRDGYVTASAKLRKAIVAELRRHRPSVVITHYPRRVLGIPLEASHPDHVAVGEAVLSAVYPDAGNSRAYPDLISEGLAPHQVKEVWIPGYEHPNHWVDATPYLDQKVAAICLHRSQLRGGSVPDWVYGWMRGAGHAPGFQYSESFTRIPVQ